MTMNPNEPFEHPISYGKIGVWCSFSGNRIVTLIFHDRPANTQGYLTIFKEFDAQLTDNGKEYNFFKKEGNVLHKKRFT